MAWKTMQFKLTGDAPLLMHNGQTADPLNKYARQLKAITGKRKKTDSDFEEMAKIEFIASLYLSKEEGPIIPAVVIDACIIEASKKAREGMLARSGFFTTGNSRFEYEGPRAAEEMWEDGRFRFSVPARVGMGRIMRTRTVFNPWHTTVNVQYEDTVVNPAQVSSWFAVAGTLVGLCDWRPRYGRFQAIRL